MVQCIDNTETLVFYVFIEWNPKTHMIFVQVEPCVCESVLLRVYVLWFAKSYKFYYKPITVIASLRKKKSQNPYYFLQAYACIYVFVGMFSFCDKRVFLVKLFNESAHMAIFLTVCLKLPRNKNPKFTLLEKRIWAKRFICLKSNSPYFEKLKSWS